MENQQSLDLIVGILALIILAGGMLMLFQGVFAMNRKK